MVLPPVASLTFITAVVVPLVLGFLVGIIVKSAIKIGVALIVIVILLIVLGVVSPDQVIRPIMSLVSSGSALTSKVNDIAGYLPYSSVTFLIGLAVGFFK